MRFRASLLAALAAGFAASVALTASDAAARSRRARAVRPEPVGRGYLRFDWPAEEDSFVARSEREWADLATRLGFDRDRAPTIDFARRMVVGIAYLSPDSGHGGGISDALVSRRDATIRWYLSELAPDSRCFVMDVVTVQYVLVSIPRTDGPVTFRQRRTVVTRCGR